MSQASTDDYYDRPNPDEPWRYACPDCGSVTIDRTNRRGRPVPGKQYRAGGVGTMNANQDRTKRFYCQPCQERKARLVDRKTGHVVAVVST